MQVEIGKIYEGKITGITKFGACVESESGVTGMVHISEIAHTYVNEIKDHVQEGQVVKVKVLSVEDKKISLSIKKAVDNPPQNNKGGQRPPRNNHNNDNRRNVWEPKKPVPQSEMSFEDMLAKFKQNSEEKQCDLKRIIDNKRKSGRRGSK